MPLRQSRLDPERRSGVHYRLQLHSYAVAMVHFGLMIIENERIRVEGELPAPIRDPGKPIPALEIHFCPQCGCVVCWRGLRLEDDGRRRIAVNVRLCAF